MYSEPHFLQDEILDAHNPEAHEKKEIRYDSPIFGCSQNLEPQSDLPVFGVAQHDIVDNPQQEFNQLELPAELLIQENDDEAILSQKLQKANDFYSEQAEKHKSKIEEIETANKTVKYQIVMKKLESAISLMSYTIQKRKACNIMSSLNAIREAAFDKPSITKYKSQLMFKEIGYSIKLLVLALDGFRERCVEDAFREIFVQAKTAKYLKLSQEESQKLQKTGTQALKAKESDRVILNKKIEDLKSTIFMQKAKEGEAYSHIRELERQIAVLDAQKMHQESTHKQMQKQLKESSDEAPKEKFNSADYSVSSFIKEMNELLDFHELSTRSEENNILFVSQGQHEIPSTNDGTSQSSKFKSATENSFKKSEDPGKY